MHEYIFAYMGVKCLCIILNTLHSKHTPLLLNRCCSTLERKSIFFSIRRLIMLCRNGAAHIIILFLYFVFCFLCVCVCYFSIPWIWVLAHNTKFNLKPKNCKNSQQNHKVANEQCKKKNTEDKKIRHLHLICSFLRNESIIVYSVRDYCFPNEVNKHILL